MRLAWTFYCGAVFAGLVMLLNLPIIGGGIILARLLEGHSWTIVSGESFFAVRDDAGRMLGKAGNASFHVVAVGQADSPRPRRLLLRLDVRKDDVFGTGGGRVRLDSWPLDAATDLRADPAFTIIAQGQSAGIDADGMLLTDNQNRRSAYSLTEGHWLFDADVPLASFLTENEKRRLFAVAVAEDDLLPGGVAVIAYASPQKMIRRFILCADDEARARVIKVSVPLSRPVARLADDGKRAAEFTLSAGLVRIPIEDDTLALAKASLPQGLKLIEITPWTGGGG